MLAKSKNIILSLFFMALAVLACNLPGGAPATEQAVGTDTATLTFTATVIPSETPSPVTVVAVCTPTVTTNTVANVRSGPGQVYGIIGSIPQGGTANVAGKNFDNTWWYIEFAGGNGGFAWIAGSVTSAVCIPDTLASIAAPPTPLVPTGTSTSTGIPTAMSTSTEVPTAVPSATATGGGGIIILPPIFIFPTATPTPFILFPIFPVPIGP